MNGYQKGTLQHPPNYVIVGDNNTPNVSVPNYNPPNVPVSNYSPPNASVPNYNAPHVSVPNYNTPSAPMPIVNGHNTLNVGDVRGNYIGAEGHNSDKGKCKKAKKWVVIAICFCIVGIGSWLKVELSPKKSNIKVEFPSKIREDQRSKIREEERSEETEMRQGIDRQNAARKKCSFRTLILLHAGFSIYLTRLIENKFYCRNVFVLFGDFL